PGTETWNRVLVSELAVEVGDPTDDLREVASRRRPLVHEVHLLSNEPPALVLRKGGDKLRLTGRNRHAFHHHGLGDETEGRHNSAFLLSHGEPAASCLRIGHE